MDEKKKTYTHHFFSKKQLNTRQRQVPGNPFLYFRNEKGEVLEYTHGIVSESRDEPSMSTYDDVEYLGIGVFDHAI